VQHHSTRVLGKFTKLVHSDKPCIKACQSQSVHLTAGLLATLEEFVFQAAFVYQQASRTTRFLSPTFRPDAVCPCNRYTTTHASSIIIPTAQAAATRSLPEWPLILP